MKFDIDAPATPNTRKIGTNPIDDFLDSFGQPVEQFEIPEPEPVPIPEPTNTGIDYGAPGDGPDLTDYLDVNADSAEMLVDVLNGVIAWIIGKFVAKSNDSEPYLLPDRETDKLKKLAAKMVPTNKPMMSPGLLFGITLIGAYTPVVSLALQNRKIEALQAENAAKDEELARIKEELQKLKGNE